MSEQSGNKYVRMAMSIFTTGGAFGINLLIQLFITPYITKTVGTDAYGFVSLAKNFAQYTMIITIALNAFASRYIAMYYHEDNIHGAQTFFASAFFGDLVVGTVLAGIAGIAILFLEHFLHIPQHLIHDVKLLFACKCLKLWRGTVVSVVEA